MAYRISPPVRHPVLWPPSQVLATKDEAVKDGLYEEAVILRRREIDYRWGRARVGVWLGRERGRIGVRGVREGTRNHSAAWRSTGCLNASPSSQLVTPLVRAGPLIHLYSGGSDLSACCLTPFPPPLSPGPSLPAPALTAACSPWWAWRTSRPSCPPGPPSRWSACRRTRRTSC